MSTTAEHTPPARATPSSSKPQSGSAQEKSAGPAQESEAPELAKPAQAGSKMPNPDLLRRQMAHCGEYTYQSLYKIGKMSSEDATAITQQYVEAVQSTEKGTALPDALTFLVFNGWQKDEIEARDLVLGLTRALLGFTKMKIAHIAFAQQNETPIDFYNDFPVISEICRIFSCPIIQVSEKDFFTVTSINPFTATAAARLISKEIEAEVGKRAFEFITTTDLNAWKYTCERHFGT